jgi:hypothetical protein
MSTEICPTAFFFFVKPYTPQIQVLIKSLCENVIVEVERSPRHDSRTTCNKPGAHVEIRLALVNFMNNEKDR